MSLLKPDRLHRDDALFVAIGCGFALFAAVALLMPL